MLIEVDKTSTDAPDGQYLISDALDVLGALRHATFSANCVEPDANSNCTNPIIRRACETED